jgi:SnoaL-like domain
MPSRLTTTNASDMATSVAAIVAFFETLTPHTIEALDCVYAADAHFKDPFNEVQGLGAIAHVYRHMFEALHGPRFAVTGRVLQGRQCFLTWDFQFRFKRFQTATVQTVRGCSHLVLDASGRIAVHRDYWDAAEELYEKIPLLGGLVRWLKKRAQP